MVPNVQLRYFLSSQANQESLRLSWLEQATAEQSSSRSYPDIAMQLALLERHERSRSSVARQLPIGLRLMPSIPQQSITATLPQQDTSHLMRLSQVAQLKVALRVAMPE